MEKLIITTLQGGRDHLIAEIRTHRQCGRRGVSFNEAAIIGSRK